MHDYKPYLIHPESTLRDAITAIDRGAAQIALVTDPANQLLGTITDGDIRRALLRGESLESPVHTVMNRNFRALHEHATDAEALALMQRETLHQAPVIDRQGRVVKLYQIDQLIRAKTLPNPVVVMAGGKGQRLKHVTSECPKPMLPVGGKPILEIILEHCIEAGFREFYFSVNYLKEQIRDYFGNGESWHVNIQYVEEDKPLGTAGALSLLPAMPEHPLLVLNGDVLTRVDYGCLLQFHSEHEAAATLCVREHTTQIPYGVVRMDDVTVYAMEEKPVLSHYVNAGIYLLEPGLLELIPPDQFFDMPELLEKAVTQQYRVNAFPIHEYWLDIGLPETLTRAHSEWET